MNFKSNSSDFSIFQVNRKIKKMLIDYSKKQSGERPRFKISDYGKCKHASVFSKNYVPK